MCLLDAVVRWDEEQILCRTQTHRDPQHPLREQGRLGAACAIEYAAQAVALHVALLPSSAPPPRGGMLTSARAVTLHVARLDDIAQPLMVSAQRLHSDPQGALYQFQVSREGIDEAALASGRLGLMFGTPP